MGTNNNAGFYVMIYAGGGEYKVFVVTPVTRCSRVRDVMNEDTRQ